MAYQGEDFIARYGARAAEATPPIRRMLEAGVLVSGKTVGGTRLYPAANCLDREQALRLWTHYNTWFSNEVGKKGQIKAGQLADLAVLSNDYFSVPEDELPHLTSALTLLGGQVVHGDGDFRKLAPELPAPMPDWSPVKAFGGVQARSHRQETAVYTACGRGTACGVHGHNHARAWMGNMPVADVQSFWGAFGCSCWAV